MKEVMLAVDIGTTNSKCVVFAPGMRVLGEGSSEYTTLALGANRFEQQPEDWWIHTKRAVNSALKAAAASPSQVRQIIVDSQGCTFLPVDGEGRPLYNGMIWMDRRAGEESAELRDLLGNRLFEITGNKPDPFFVLAKLLWFRKHYPDRFEKTRHVLQVNGYVNYRLTGEFALDETHAPLTEVYDVYNRRYSREILDALGLDESLFPEVRPAYAPAGYITRAASEETRLPEGTEVLMGAIDATAAALEGGVKPHVAVEITGTSSVLSVISRDYLADPVLTLMESPIPHHHTTCACMSSSGASLKWFRDTLYTIPDTHEDKYTLMNREILRDCPGPSGLLFLPYLAGERSPLWDSEARGVFYGLRLDTTRAHMLRAVMEGVAMAIYDNYLALKRTGIEITGLRSVGGHTKSDLWSRIKASILDMPIEIPKTNRGAIGGLMAVSAAARGEFSSIEEACGCLFEIDRVIEPNHAWTEYYREQFELYKLLYENNCGINKTLSRLTPPKC